MRIVGTRARGGARKIVQWSTSACARRAARGKSAGYQSTSRATAVQRPVPPHVSGTTSRSWRCSSPRRRPVTQRAVPARVWSERRDVEPDPQLAASSKARRWISPQRAPRELRGVREPRGDELLAPLERVADPRARSPPRRPDRRAPRPRRRPRPSTGARRRRRERRTPSPPRSASRSPRSGTDRRRRRHRASAAAPRARQRSRASGCVSRRAPAGRPSPPRRRQRARSRRRAAATRRAASPGSCAARASPG